MTQIKLNPEMEGKTQEEALAMSPAEVRKKYKEAIGDMKLEHEYTRLECEIMEYNLRRMMAMGRIAQMQMQMQEETGTPETTAE